MDDMAIKMDAQYKEIKEQRESCNHCGGNHATANCSDDDTPMLHEEEAKFMNTFRCTRYYENYRDCDCDRERWRPSAKNEYNREPYKQTNTDEKPDVQTQLDDFIKSQKSTNTFMDLKDKLESSTRNHQASIQNLEAKFDRFAEKQSGRASGSLTSNTQPNPTNKPYQPPQARHEHVNAITTRNGTSYDPPHAPSQTQQPVEVFTDDEEEDELVPQKETITPEIPVTKPYKPIIPYPQRLIKEKMEAQYGKFLDIIRAVRINVSLVNVLAGMPNYGKFLKELVSNKSKLKQISATLLIEECSDIVQNKIPPKLGNPGSFLIPCTFSKTFSCNALADLGASINLMPYSVYAKLSIETLKPTKMSVRLADQSF